MAGTETASFSVELKDDLSSSASAAASSLERLKTKIQGDQKALNEMQAAMKRLQSGTSVNVETHKALKDKIDATKSSLAKSQEKFLAMGGTFGGMKDKIKPAKEEVHKFGESLQQAGGPLGQMSSQVSQLGEMLASPEGIIAAMAALAVGVVVGVGALTIFGIACADAARSARLLLEAQTGSAANAGAMGAWINNLAEKLPLAREQLRQMVSAMTDKGLQGNPLAIALKAVSTATAALGASAGGKIQAIAEGAVRTRRLIIGMFDLQGTGVSIDDVARQLGKTMKVSVQEAKGALQNGRVEIETGLKALDAAVQERFGGIVAKQALALPNQFEKAKESFAGLFSGLNIDPVLEALHSVLHLLDSSTSSGKALKNIAERMLQPLINAIASTGPFAKAMFKGMVIAALLLENVYLRVKIALKKAIPPEMRPTIDSVNTGVTTGVVVVGALAGAFAFLALAVLACIALALLPFALAGFAIWNAVKTIGAAIDGLKAAFDGGVTYLKALVPNFTAIGYAMMGGLAGGITNGGPAAVSAMNAQADKIMANANKKFERHSPSRWFYRLARDNWKGFIGGDEDSADDIERSSNNTLRIPMDGAASGGAGGAAGAHGGSRASITIAEGAIQIIGVKDANELTSEGFLRRLIGELQTAVAGAGLPLETA